MKDFSNFFTQTFIFLALILFCVSPSVKIVKEDSLRNDTESIKTALKTFEKDASNPDKGFREDRFDTLKSQILSYTEKCSLVEKQKDALIQELTNENFKLNKSVEAIKIKSAQDLQKEVSNSAEYRTKAGQWEGLVYTLSFLLGLIVVGFLIYVYLQIKNLGPSAVLSSLKLVKGVIP